MTEATCCREAIELVDSQPFDLVLADIRLPDPDGETHRLGDLWAEAPAVLVFLRHYG